ncbi:AAA family ATPase [Aurantiacibacter marinus]|uniref:AAA+ ATPase domain-containing protein n=1 Tax=Aurantiacibacter marinus TaxID=874156 RepID=A0A0H0XR85_9SPHN|nr:AAA family ATPase [Aurantiacibacter marinus]KLI64516.1 hypothetical protein AAV99_02720 [Aurantiacibacter marinus]
MTEQGSPSPFSSPAVGILAELQAQPIWLLWKYEPNESPGGKPRKVPYYCNGKRRKGTLDSPTDRQQLCTFDAALAAFDGVNGFYSGIGIALGPDGRGGQVQGCDFDDIEANGLSDIANSWVRGDFAGKGYVEQSPSGNGLHIIGYGRPFTPLNANGSGIEAYPRARFFTFTGQSAILGSQCEKIDLAEYVEAELATRHSPQPAERDSQTGTTFASSQTVSELRSALAHLRSDERDLWIRMGMALKELGDTGRGLWVDWSQTSEKFNARDAAQSWESFNPRSTGYKAVFAEAQRMGWVNPNSNAAQFQSGSAGQRTSSRELVGRLLAGVTMRAIDWLWEGWIPIGYLTIFAGESGAGKSTVLADIAARVSTGDPWPGEDEDRRRPPGRVLWLGSEDSIEEMTVPRLTACGADLNNILEIIGTRVAGSLSTFSLQDDLKLVEHWLQYAREEGRPIQMLVIDPITSYLPGQRLRKVDLNDAGQLRSILEPWLRFASAQNIAVVCVTHFSKDTSRSMLNRVLGSAAFAQTCRSLCAVLQQPSDEEGFVDPHAKVLLQVKGNLPEHPGGGWRFTTEKAGVGIDPRNGKPIFATRPNWGELDAALSPENIVGKARGPVSAKPNMFRLWLNNFFRHFEPEEWVEIEKVKAAAVSVDKIVSLSWWNKHSAEFLEKQNDGGKWFCRRQRPPSNTP